MSSTQDRADEREARTAPSRLVDYLPDVAASHAAFQASFIKSDLLDVAYRPGYELFPLYGKSPFGRDRWSHIGLGGGSGNATSSTHRLRLWQRLLGYRMTGFGRKLPMYHYVADCDTLAAAQRFIEEHNVPLTAANFSGRGLQVEFLYFGSPSDLNAEGEALEDIDLIKPGQYVVAPGSQHWLDAHLDENGRKIRNSDGLVERVKPYKTGMHYGVAVDAPPAVASAEMVEVFRSTAYIPAQTVSGVRLPEVSPHSHDSYSDLLDRISDRYAIMLHFASDISGHFEFVRGRRSNMGASYIAHALQRNVSEAEIEASLLDPSNALHRWVAEDYVGDDRDADDQLGFVRHQIKHCREWIVANPSISTRNDARECVQEMIRARQSATFSATESGFEAVIRHMHQVGLRTGWLVLESQSGRSIGNVLNIPQSTVARALRKGCEEGWWRHATDEDLVKRDALPGTDRRGDSAPTNKGRHSNVYRLMMPPISVLNARSAVDGGVDHFDTEVPVNHDAFAYRGLSQAGRKVLATIAAGAVTESALFAVVPSDKRTIRKHVSRLLSHGLIVQTDAGLAINGDITVALDGYVDEQDVLFGSKDTWVPLRGGRERLIARHAAEQGAHIEGLEEGAAMRKAQHDQQQEEKRQAAVTMASNADVAVAKVHEAKAARKARQDAFSEEEATQLCAALNPEHQAEVAEAYDADGRVSTTPGKTHAVYSYKLKGKSDPLTRAECETHAADYQKAQAAVLGAFGISGVAVDNSGAELVC